MQKLVDGKGVQRVAKPFCNGETEVKVRLATLEDSDDVLSWRNDSVTRSMSFETAHVDKESHNKWFLDTLENPNQVLVIGYQRSTKVGIVKDLLCRKTA